MDKPRKFIDIVIPFNNEYLNLQILLPKILRVLKKIKYFKYKNFGLISDRGDGNKFI